MTKIRNVLCGAVALMLGLTGCAGYRLGSMLPPDIKTVYVPTFINRTTEPMIETETTAAVIRQLQQDGSMKVVSSEEADAVLEVTVKNYELEPLAYSEVDKTTANEYRIRLTAAVVLRRLSPDEVVVEAPSVQGESTFLMEGDFTTSKQRGLPAAAADLAHSIVERVVEAW